MNIEIKKVKIVEKKNCGKYVKKILILIYIENYPMRIEPKSMGDPNSHWDPMGIGDFMIKFHKLQNYFLTILTIFFIIIHVLGAHYQYAKFHNDALINKQIRFANNPDLQT